MVYIPVHTCTPLMQKAEASQDEGWLGPQDDILFSKERQKGRVIWT